MIACKLFSLSQITTEKNSLKTILRQVEENLDQKNVKYIHNCLTVVQLIHFYILPRCNELYKKNVDLQDFCNSLTIETKVCIPFHNCT